MFMEVKRDWREGGEEEDCIYHHNFCEGSRTEDFLYSFCCGKDEKWEFFGGLMRGGEVIEEDLGIETSRPCIDYFILF